MQEEQKAQEDPEGKDNSPKKLGKRIRVKKVKAPRPRKFKKGKWNPDIDVVPYSLHRDHPSKDPLVDDCIKMNNLNAIRAVFNNDLKLMEKVYFDVKNISTLVE